MAFSLGEATGKKLADTLWETLAYAERPWEEAHRKRYM